MIRVKDTWVRAEDVISIGIAPFMPRENEKRFSVTVEVIHPTLKVLALTLENMNENMANLYAKDWAQQVHAELLELKK